MSITEMLLLAVVAIEWIGLMVYRSTVLLKKMQK